jgi:hypothetical protein
VRLVLAVLGMLPATPALALEVVEGVLQVSYTHNGTSYVFNDSYVPLLPANVCYTWYLRVDAAATPLTFVERMTLPQAIQWGTPGSDPGDETVIEQGGRVAVTTLPVTTDDLGWFSHGWCAAEGDPTGEHLFEISVDGAELMTFPFTVVAPESYTFPGPTVPERAHRSASNTW